MKAYWFYQSHHPDPEDPQVIVFASSHKEARKHARFFTDFYDPDDIHGERLPKADEYAPEGNEPNYLKDVVILRKLGWQMSDDEMCVSCGLYEMGEVAPVCQECGGCSECGHSNDCYFVKGKK